MPSLLIVCVVMASCAGGYSREGQRRWDEAQQSQSRADAALADGRLDEGASLYAESWRQVTDPSSPEGSPSAWGVGRAMARWTELEPELADRWKPLVADAIARMDSPEAGFGEMNGMLRITEAAGDDASLVRYFDHVVRDWRKVALWKSERSPNQEAQRRLGMAGRPDLAQAIAPTGTAAQRDPDMEAVGQVLSAPGRAVLGRLMTPR